MKRGEWGEQAARAYLQKLGWRVVETNFRTRFGEIDIIAQCGQYIIFVEVKTRKDDRFAAAREHVTFTKQQKILAAAETWLQRYPSGLQPRFDVIEVYGEEDGEVPRRVNLLENAFGGA
ncbi:YraN family protein [Agathobaculum sp.]|uniref:YraN family protein n=1 Tax=Agathobaculum sp. TaxID=2048138 RepID=UPI002A827842|nr:YraN family protein [Agathobaculum sp.]MDY3617724.1 YraN family protein [Agathobaculum sp.]